VDHLVPGERIAAEGGYVGGGDVRGLEVDGVEGAEDQVVYVYHIGGDFVDDVRLVYTLVRGEL